MAAVAVMGAGSWGTAFALMCADAGSDTRLWARDPELAEQITGEHRNERYLPGTDLPDSLVASADPEQVLDGASVVVLGVPSAHVGDQLAQWGQLIGANATLVSLIKGVDVDTRRFGSQMIVDALGCDPDRLVVVSGPNLAKECARRLPAATVAAGPDPVRAEQVQATVMTPFFRVYTDQDRAGVEIGGAVKNVIALSAGMATGMGFGDNTLATVITRGLAEMTRFGVALGADALTFAGLSGVGDLVATCTSPHSRNRTVGERLGRGEQLADIIASMHMVAEGVKSSRAIVALAREVGVEMPIAEGVVAVCHQGRDPRELGTALMSRDAKPERYGLKR